MCPLRQIGFHNNQRPDFSFDLLRYEDLMRRDLDHDISHAHRVGFYSIQLITRGEGQHILDFTSYEYRPATVFMIRKDQVHAFVPNNNARGYILLFTDEFLISHYSKQEVLSSFHMFNDHISSPVMHLDSDSYSDITRLILSIQQEYSNPHDSYALGIIRSTLHIVLLKLLRVRESSGPPLGAGRHQESFLQLQRLVEQHAFETRKTADYARMMHCSTKTLNNVCRAVVDKSAKQLIDELVILQLKRLLVSTPRTIHEVAYEAGFDEPTNFFKYFKRLTGESPQSFRSAR